MPGIRLEMTQEQFRALPRNPAYHYEYRDGLAWLAPDPRYYHAVLPLALPPESGPPPADVETRPATESDFEALLDLFAAAFRGVQPFASLQGEALREAARRSLERTLDGQDGPWIRAASFVARHAGSDEPVGAALVTLLPLGDPCDQQSYYWDGPAPEEAVARRLGRAHLTWIFAAQGRQGVGGALLREVARALLALGFEALYTTFLLGNESSLLWHWRHGFRLLSRPSRRGARRPG